MMQTGFPEATAAGAAVAPPPLHVAALRDQSVDAFVGDLRKFVLHRTLNSALAGRQVDLEEDPAITLSTEVADLRGWFGWSARARVFLGTLHAGEPLDLALSPYKRQVLEYCRWLGAWQASLYRCAVEELADLARPRRAGARLESLDPPADQAMVPESWLVNRVFTTVG